ncbi:hypothetical protein RJ640_012402 [Escallonia rubra]|uniref:Phosphatidylinositol transfer protein N-terminal domain-containing protein n=1 Tax=Escallonia rubra TaxID=112253 RepID=A0AA88UB20_9ASTE|nr:hypothetical protein RJ640_012402 [Escallonia rubra]
MAEVSCSEPSFVSSLHGCREFKEIKRGRAVVNGLANIFDWTYGFAFSLIPAIVRLTLFTLCLLIFQDSCNPVVTAYKLVTIDAPYWGFGSRLEQALLSGERALFLESHRNCFAWIDEWYGLTVEVMPELEKQSEYLQRK